MVQMKVTEKKPEPYVQSLFISHMVQMKELAYTLNKTLIALYIPHGSDER